MASEEAVLEALKQVQVPDLHQDLVTLGMVKNLKVQHGLAVFTVELTSASAGLQALLDPPIKAALRQVPGLTDSAVHYMVRPSKPPAKADSMAATQAATKPAPDGAALPAAMQAPKGPARPRGVRHVIAVGSGKGGVGKSTVTVNLALALAARGLKVGLLDADIYGPSIPFMLGVADRKPGVKDEKLQPIAAHGLAVMSMGFLLPRVDDPVVWRGPMLAGAMRQFFQDVAWGELDYLLVDLPPGTGDVPLSLVQLTPLDGAIIVITPQPVAAAIGLKTLRMLQQSRVPIMGVVENMSHFVCGHCQHETAIFDRGGGRQVAEREGIPFLGEIPLDPVIRASGDAGKPVVAAAPDSPQAAAFRQLAIALLERVSVTSSPA